MLATIVTVATLVIHLWFLYSSSYEIVWHGVEFEDDEDDDTDATANNNSTPTVNDDTLAFTIARLITDKLDSSNSALKETMSRQADDINSMLRRLSALEAKGATSRDTRHSDGLDSPLLIAAKRRIAHLEELSEVNKRKQDEEIEQLRQEHLSHLQIVRSTREFELDEDTENTFIAAQNIAIDLVNADTLHLDAERTTLLERVNLTENSLIPDLERRLANAKLDWDSCKAKFFELRALIGPYGLPRDIYKGRDCLAKLLETHTSQIDGVLDAIKGNPLVSGIIYTYPTADDETVTQTCDTISGGDMRLMRSTLSGPSAPSQDVGQSGSQEQPGINNSASSSMVQPESIHNDLQNTGLDCHVPLPGPSSTDMPDASSEVPLPAISSTSTSFAHDELEPHPTTANQLDTHPTSYPSPATSGSDAQDEAIECRPSAFQIPPSQTTSPFGLQEGSAPLQSKGFVFTFTPGTSRAPATENPAGGSSKEQSTAPFSFSAQSPSPSPTGHEPATSTDPQRTASPSPPPPSPSPSPTTSPFGIQEEVAPLQPVNFRFSFSPGNTTAPATQSPNRASPEYQPEPGPGTQLPHPPFPYPTAHEPTTDPRFDGVHLQHSSPSPSLFTSSPTAPGPRAPPEKKKSSKKKKNRRY